MTTSVSTLEQQNQMLQYLQQMNTQASTLEAQISTGQVSTTYAGIAPQAGEVIDLQATQSQQQGYINTITAVNSQLQTASLAEQNIASVATTFQNMLANDAYSTSGANIQETAQQLLTEVGSYLNTQGATGYLFSGNQTSTPAFNPAGLPSPNANPLLSNIPASTAYYGGDNGIAQATVDTNNTIQYGVTGNNPAFEQIIRVLNFFANDATPLSQTNANDVANVQQGQQMLTNAVQSVQQIVATNGEQQADINNLSTAHKNAMTLASTSLNNIEQVDSATAITQLNTLQTQLQASYQTINILQGLSLSKYLSG